MKTTTATATAAATPISQVGMEPFEGAGEAGREGVEARGVAALGVDGFANPSSFPPMITRV